jgi:nucleoside-diphosphate-sugar epimerase
MKKSLTAGAGFIEKELITQESKMKIGILGSNGFIGSNLDLHLRNTKKFKVYCLSSFNKYKVRWIEKILHDIKKYKPDIIINCAADQNSKEGKKAIIDLLNSNLKANVLFIKQAIKNNNFKGYISFGTKWEFNENGEFDPLNFYAATKHANDVFFKYFSSKNNITIVSLKIFETYGKFDKRKRILNLLLKSYKQQKILNVSPGNQFLDYVHISEICELIELICDDILKNKLKGFNIFAVSSKKPIKLKSLIKEINKNLIKKIKVIIGGKKYRINEAMKPIRGINNYPGWKSKLNLIKELKKIFDEDKRK